jgi:mycothiol synthase
MEWTIRPFRGEDTAEVVGLLQRTLPAESITPGLIARRVLLDPNFDVKGAPVAVAGGEVVGFLLAIRRLRPLEDGPDDRDRGWITLFAVDDRFRRQGVGSAMLEAGLTWLRDQGCARALVSPYAPNYWTPGVDVRAYPEAVAFLESHGFTVAARPLSMAAPLDGGWSVPQWLPARQTALESSGVRLVPFDLPHAIALTDFLRAEFPGDWQRCLRESMIDIAAGRRPPDDILLAYDGEELAGFAQHEGERFGPFGIAQSQRGRGIGALLLFRMLETMRGKGLRNAWFLWTDDATADRLYRSAGFAETRRYSVMSRSL